jgi:GT2 family glycosyltransferase
LIVDNNSNDDEKKLLYTLKSDKLEILELDDNYGYSYAINRGAMHFISKYDKCNFIISNSDIVIMSENDIKSLVDTLNDETVGLVGPQVMELGTISRGYKCPSPFIDGLFNFKMMRKLFDDMFLFYREDYYKCDISSVDIISSSFFLISSDTLQRINYLDENVFLYYEDYILGKKVKDLGLLSVVVNKVKIKHLHSVSIDKVINQVEKLKYLYRSQFYFHTTYNDTNELEKIFLKLTQSISVWVKKISILLKKI